MRLPHAMTLYKKDWADRLVLTGDGFNGHWHRSAKQQGVLGDRLIALKDPTTTREEVLACSEKFAQMPEIKTVILVTSDYHSRRAYAEFEHWMPNIKTISSPSTTPPQLLFPKRREWYAYWWYFVTRPFDSVGGDK